MVPFWKSRNPEDPVIRKMLEWLQPVNRNDREDSEDLCLGLPGDFFTSDYIVRAHAAMLGRGDNKHGIPSDDQETEWDFIEKKSENLYEIVLRCLNGNVLRLSGSVRSFSQDERELIVSTLRRNGYNVSLGDFKYIIAIAKSVSNSPGMQGGKYRFPHEEFRHASLNCFDYERFKEEMARLQEEIGPENVKREGRTLSKIYFEALEGENEEYPGRHLPYDRLRGRTSTRYQCLRILDEILCTATNAMTKDEIRHKAYDKAMEIGIASSTPESGKVSYADLTDSKLNTLFNILHQLLDVEYSGGKKNAYARNVYASGGKRGTKIYKEFRDGCRLEAFSVDFSRAEAFKLRQEVGIIRVKYFDDDKE